MIRIVMACFRYAQQHNNQFPNDLAQLQEQGITAKDLINPARPEQDPGFIYLRPKDIQSANPTRSILFYEAHDAWRNGIIVSYVDGHTAFLADQAEFLKLLDFTNKQNAEAVVPTEN